MKKRIGVYVCHCGGNISDYVDIEKVKAAVKNEAGVYLVKNTLFACSDSTQKEMVADIQANDLDAIVVASCSPKLHVPTFRGVADRAGLNRYHYVQVNIREQGSWAHSDQPLGATEKAIHLVKAGISRAYESESLTPMVIPAVNVVAVIGAGVGGLRSAIALADMGSEVYLLEKAAEAGGHVASMGPLFTTDVHGRQLVGNLLEEVYKRPNIKLFTNAEMVEKKGSIGSFDIQVKVGADLLPLHVGAFVVNTGFDNYQPMDNEYGYGLLDNVITLPEFKELIDEAPEGKPLVFHGKKIQNVAYIYCVGARQDETGPNTYCSRFCCTAVIHSSIQVQKKFPDITNLHFHRGIRTYGKQELLYEESSRNGDLYLQFSLDSIPKVELRDRETWVSVKDILTHGQIMEVQADLVVLVTSMVARKNGKLDSLLKLPLSRDGFYNEIHMKLRPVETVIEGVLIAGTCQSPKNILETMNSSMAAAAKANSMLTKGEMTLDPTLARINPAACIWCDACTQICPYDAIVQTQYEGKPVASVNIGNCKGCGHCTPVCPTDAIDLAGFTNAQMEGMIDALAQS
jgi:heterodisulfide reductase subunit A2